MMKNTLFAITIKYIYIYVERKKKLFNIFQNYNLFAQVYIHFFKLIRCTER